MKKFATMAISTVLVGTMALGGSLAYLSGTDSDVNVMTLGNVSIEQIEQEWNNAKTELQDFTQAKPLLPYVGTFGWENDTNDDGAYRRFTMNNVVDKYVTVKNTGNTNAYVRTVIALEMGDYSYEEFTLVGASINKVEGTEFSFPGAWEWKHDGVAQIDGKNYNIMVAEHKNALKPGETTIPSLLQVYLSKDATNETCEKLDGNKNGTYDILVLSQAVQAEGFGSAGEALNAAFPCGTNYENVAGWFGGVTIPTGTYVASEEELKAAVAAGGDIVLANNITLTDTVTVPQGVTVNLNLNGYTINQEKDCTDSYSMIGNEGELTITGDGKISFTDLSAGGDSTWGSYTICNYGTLIVENGTIEHKGSSQSNSHPTNIPIQNYTGKVTINGGTISSPQFRSVRDFTAGGEIIINGGTFQGQVWMQGLGNGSSSLTITGGNFSPTAGYDGSSVYITNNTNDIVVNITGGTFNTKIGCADATKAGVLGKITGGTFAAGAYDNTNQALFADSMKNQ